MEATRLLSSEEKRGAVRRKMMEENSKDYETSGWKVAHQGGKLLHTSEKGLLERGKHSVFEKTENSHERGQKTGVGRKLREGEGVTRRSYNCSESRESLGGDLSREKSLGSHEKVFLEGKPQTGKRGLQGSKVWKESLNK